MFYIKRIFTPSLLSRVSTSIKARKCLPHTDLLKKNRSRYIPQRLASSKNIQKFVTKVNQEQFLNGTSAIYIENLYDSWLSDRKSVNASWNRFFEKSLDEEENTITESQKIINDNLALQSVILAYQTHGHYIARTDPLELSEVYSNKNYPNKILYSTGVPTFPDSEMDRVFKLPTMTMIGGKDRSLSLKDIFSRLENTYCRSIGVEYMFLDSFEQCNWIKEMIEVPDKMSIDKKEKLRIFTHLAKATRFESFLARKWTSEKRFGLEGCEVLIPAMNEIIDKSSAYGINSINIGMPHRGRLNVLANVCQKPLNTIFARFQSLEAKGNGSGDVKYHLGTYSDLINEITNKKIRLTVVSNPSHLEAVDPVVQGKTHAEQFFRNDSIGKEVMSILLHGDSSFCGQGVVYETFHLAGLPDYTTHGTIHLVVNNQIGFTANPNVSRSSPYCTDVAKVVKAPIFHVNADDPEAVIRVCKIAAEWRHKFKKDVVIDLIGYRRNGHNELDEPMFTQPTMYKIIKKTMPVLEKYSKTLRKDNVATVEELKKITDHYETIYEKEFSVAQKETQTVNDDWLDSPWTGFFKENDNLKVSKTGVKFEVLEHIGNVFSSIPPNDKKFVTHKGIDRIFKIRQQLLKDYAVDWALAEAMAFGSLLKEGVHVRLSGQDVERGTFSHRHHVLHDQNVNSVTYRSLCNLYPDQARYTVCNSSLSEFAVVGFELGYSMTNPKALVCWEAQFGDFNNNAQCIIDQFISSGQSKWMKQSGLVMLLPHGYEGMGPEHSSARLERFLQMSADDSDIIPKYDNMFAICQLHATNWIIANCSTPANYFHVLRRQIALPFRKPLIIMTPKSLLRHPEATSCLLDMAENTEFLRVIPERGVAAEYPNTVTHLIFCSGKVYYDLIKARAERNLLETVAICCVEQISPFPFDLVMTECDKYINAKIVWTQEEPKNQGAWYYVQARLRTMSKRAENVLYVGRPVAASPASGSKEQHTAEMNKFLDEAFTVQN